MSVTRIRILLITKLSRIMNPTLSIERPIARLMAESCMPPNRLPRAVPMTTCAMITTHWGRARVAKPLNPMAADAINGPIKCPAGMNLPIHNPTAPTAAAINKSSHKGRPLSLPVRTKPADDPTGSPTQNDTKMGTELSVRMILVNCCIVSRRTSQPASSPKVMLSIKPPGAEQ